MRVLSPGWPNSGQRFGDDLAFPSALAEVGIWVSGRPRCHARLGGPGAFWVLLAHGTVVRWIGVPETSTYSPALVAARGFGGWCAIGVAKHRVGRGRVLRAWRPL
jgi:hypothetical protein